MYSLEFFLELFHPSVRNLLPEAIGHSVRPNLAIGPISISSKIHHSKQRELFYSFWETIRVIIHLNSHYCFPYCWLPIKKFPLIINFGCVRGHILAMSPFRSTSVILCVSREVRLNNHSKIQHIRFQPDILSHSLWKHSGKQLFWWKWSIKVM